MSDEIEKVATNIVAGISNASGERWHRQIEMVSACLTAAEARGYERGKEAALKRMDDWFDEMPSKASMNDLIAAIRSLKP